MTLMKARFSAVCQEPVSGNPASSILSVALEPSSPAWEKVPVSPIHSEWDCADALRCASIFSSRKPRGGALGIDRGDEALLELRGDFCAHRRVLSETPGGD